MKSLNRVTLIGNIGKEIELKYTSGGVAYANFSIATTESWKDKSGEQKERTDWHNCIVWDKSAEILSKYASKGSRLYVDGKLQNDTFEKDGVKHYSTKIKVDDFLLLDGRSNSAPKAEERGPKAEMEPTPSDDLPF